MDTKLYLNIADINIMLDSGNVSMPRITDKQYAQFLNTTFDTDNSNKKIDLIWHVKHKNFIISDDITELATFPASNWRVFRNTTKETLIIPKRQTTEFPSYSIHFTHDFKDINIYGGDITLVMANGTKSFSRFFLYPTDGLIFTHFLLKTNNLAMHAAAVEFDGKGYIFTGLSGSEKSTITKLFSEFDITSWLSDERVVLKFNQQSNITVHGTPWPSSAGRALNKGTPLAGIFFISHGADPVIKQLTPQAAMVKLFDVATIPWYDAEYTESGCAVLTKIINDIPIYEFSYRLEENAVRAWQEFVT